MISQFKRLSYRGYHRFILKIRLGIEILYSNNISINRSLVSASKVDFPLRKDTKLHDEWRLKLIKYSELGQIDEINQAIYSMQKDDIFLSSNFLYVHKLKAFLVKKDSTGAHDYLLTIPRKDLTVNMIKIAVLTCAACADVATAHRCIEYSRGEGVSTNISLWNALMATYAEAGDFINAKKALEDMHLVYRILPSTMTFNKALKAALKCKNYLAIKNLVGLMNEWGVDKDSATISTLINCAIEAGYVNEAVDILETSLKLSPSILNNSSFHVLMKHFAYCKEFAKVSVLFNEMVTIGVKPDKITYFYLNLSATKTGNRTALNNYFEDMLGRDIHFTSEKEWKVFSNLFIKSSDAKGLQSVISKIHTKLGRKGLGLLPAMFTDLMVILRNLGCKNQLLETIRNMNLTYNMEPTIECWEQVVLFHTDHGDWNSAISILKTVQDKYLLTKTQQLMIWREIFKARVVDSKFKSNLILDLSGFIDYLLRKNNMHLESDMLSGLFLTIRENSISSHPNLEVELFEFIFSSYARDEIDFQFKLDSIMHFFKQGYTLRAYNLLLKSKESIDIMTLKKILSPINNNKELIQILDEIPRDFLHLSTEKDLNFTLYQIRTFTQAGLNVKAIHCAERYLDFIYSKDREISRFNQLDCDLFKEYLFLLHKTCSNKIESLSFSYISKLMSCYIIDTKNVDLIIEMIKTCCELNKTEIAQNVASHLCADQKLIPLCEIIHSPILEYFLARKDYENARNVLEKMLDYKMTPSNSIYKYFTIHLSERTFPKILNWVKSMNRFDDKRLLFEAWVQLVKVCYEKEMLENILFSMDEMRRNNERVSIHPDSECWLYCLTSFASSDKIEEAVDCLYDMTFLDGVTPSIQHFQIPLAYISQHGDYELGLRCLKRMREVGLTPSQREWTALLSAALVDQDLDRMMPMAIDQMIRLDNLLSPDINLFKKVIMYHTQSKDAKDKLTLLFDQLIENNLMSKKLKQEILEFLKEYEIYEVVYDYFSKQIIVC